MGLSKSRLLAGCFLLGAVAAVGGCETTCPESAETCPAGCPPIHGLLHPGAGTCLESAIVLSCKGRNDAKRSEEPGCVRVRDPKDLSVYKLNSATEEYWLTLAGSAFEPCPDNVRARALAADTCDDWALSDAGADAESDAAADASVDGAAGTGAGGAAGAGGTAGSAGTAGTGGAAGTGGTAGTGATGGTAGNGGASAGGSAGSAGASAGGSAGAAVDAGSD